MELMKKLINDEEGQGLVEYALIVGLISIACIITMTALGGKIGDVWTSITNALRTS